MEALVIQSLCANKQQQFISVIAYKKADKITGFEKIPATERNRAMETDRKFWLGSRQATQGSSQEPSFPSVEKLSARRGKARARLPPVPASDEIVEAVTFLTNDADVEINRAEMFSPSFGVIPEGSPFEVIAMGSPIGLACHDTPKSKFDFSLPQCLDISAERAPPFQQLHGITDQTQTYSYLAEINDPYCLAEVSLKSVLTEEHDEDTKTRVLGKKKRRTIVRGKSRATNSLAKSRVEKAI